jgi:hypothetical protein
MARRAKYFQGDEMVAYSSTSSSAMGTFSASGRGASSPW